MSSPGLHDAVPLRVQYETYLKDRSREEIIALCVQDGMTADDAAVRVKKRLIDFLLAHFDRTQEQAGQSQVNNSDIKVGRITTAEFIQTLYSQFKSIDEYYLKQPELRSLLEQQPDFLKTAKMVSELQNESIFCSGDDDDLCFDAEDRLYLGADVNLINSNLACGENAIAVLLKGCQYMAETVDYLRTRRASKLSGLVLDERLERKQNLLASLSSLLTEKYQYIRQCIIQDSVKHILFSEARKYLDPPSSSSSSLAFP